MYRELKKILYEEQKCQNNVTPNRNINNEKEIIFLKKGPNRNSGFEKYNHRHKQFIRRAWQKKAGKNKAEAIWGGRRNNKINWDYLLWETELKIIKKN